ncbi:6-phosphogluconate dehydrogenase [Hyaloraphidium curvatum]|nr:6-phosphogluconate dehydrogenase [Hyaloraphidium curvatum]
MAVLGGIGFAVRASPRGNVARWARDAIGAAGGTFVDCPMSGGISGAAAGTLTFMVGTDDCESPPASVDESTPLLDALRPWLLTMGETVYLVGQAGGTAQTAKLLNNANEYSALMALSETLLVGRAHGIHPGLLTSIVNASTGATYISRSYNPAPGVLEGVPSSRGYAMPGFPLGGGVKDLSLAVEAAKEVGIEAPLTELVYETNKEAAKDEEMRKLDYTVIYRALERKWGLGS